MLHEVRHSTSCNSRQGCLASQDGGEFFRTLTGIGSNSDSIIHALSGVNAIALVDDYILYVMHATVHGK